MFEKVQQGDSFLVSFWNSEMKVQLPSWRQMGCVQTAGPLLTSHWESRQSDVPQQASSAFWGKRLQGASLAPHVLGTLSVLKGMVGMNGNRRGAILSGVFPGQLPRACLLASLELQPFLSSFRPNSSCCSVTKLCLTLYDPLQHTRLLCPLLSPGVCSDSCPLSWWCYLILCCSIFLLPSIFPSIWVFYNELALLIRWPKYWSFSCSISPSNDYSGLSSFRIDWFDLLVVQGTLKSLLQYHSSKASVLQRSAFFISGKPQIPLSFWNFKEEGSPVPAALQLTACRRLVNATLILQGRDHICVVRCWIPSI